MKDKKKSISEMMYGMTDQERIVFKNDCQRGFGSVCENMTCAECIEKKAYIGQEEKETEACTQD